MLQTPQLQTASDDLNEDSKEDTDACGEYSSPIRQSLPLPLYTPRESIAEATTTVTDLLQPDYDLRFLTMAMYLMSSTDFIL